MKIFHIRAFLCIFLFLTLIHTSLTSQNNTVNQYDVSPETLGKMTDDLLQQWSTWYKTEASLTSGRDRDYWEMKAYYVDLEIIRRQELIYGAQNEDYNSQEDEFFDYDMMNYVYQGTMLKYYIVDESTQTVTDFVLNESLPWMAVEDGQSYINTFVGNSFHLFYEEPSEELNDVASLVYQSDIFEAMAADLDSLLDLPSPVQISFTTGKPGPLYYDGQIYIPYEFLNLVNTMSKPAMATDIDYRAQVILDVTEFVIYHEVGHAIIDKLDIPVLGKEEDAVDQFAAIISAVWDLEEIALSAAGVFELFGANKSEFNKEDFWDSHSLDQQRMYNIVCLLYGNEPKVYAKIANDFGFTAEFKDRCKRDFAEASRSWLRLLGDAVR